jgi:branched-chain amino acid:cation transporter, LIVCS family
MYTPAARSTTLATGLAMFSMFFGAGNVVFPLALGQYAQNQNIYAILGLLITAVGVPFLGLIAMTLYDGNYKHFFNRMGKGPGYLMILIIMGLIGPFGALPRCIALSYATLKTYLPFEEMLIFNIFSCCLIFLVTFRKNQIVNLLGYILTPILLISLLTIIVKGLWLAPAAPETAHLPLPIFIKGLQEGYQTMDLLGAFFFCSVVLTCLKKGIMTSHSHGEVNYRHLIFMTLKASCLGAFLLGSIYIGFSYVAAFHSLSLEGLAKEDLLGTLAYTVLGPYAGIVAAIAVALACLTTAIALAAVFAEYVHKELLTKEIPYSLALVGTLIISCVVASFNFTGILIILAPILEVCYPSLIVLCLVNSAHKLFHFQWVKAPVLATFCLSFIYFILN